MMFNSPFKNRYMDLALHKAREAYEKGEVPVGAVIVNNDGEIMNLQLMQLFQIMIQLHTLKL